ncbi:NB-ARC - like 10 [Theobroma cacao]|nr:NB-ARC - like 10 [Theobroma cacao]
MAETIPYRMVSNILSKLVWLAGQELGLIFGLKKDLEKLQETLSTIKAVLLDADEKQESDRALKNWILRLEDVVYDADDLLDEFDYEILRQKVLDRGQVSKFFSSSNPLAFGLKMRHRIKEIRERLNAVAADKSKFNLRERVVILDMKAKNTDRETASKVRPDLIIGREKDKEHIIESLLKEQNHGDSINIVAIVGFGGLGKTSLAQLVCADVKVKSYFDQEIWVRVSQEFDVSMIFKKILKSLIYNKVGDLDLDQVQTILDKKLRGKRYLLVLDDVWNENNLKWDDFSKYLVFGAPGSKILVTTRSKAVASTMGVCVPYLLEGLNEHQSWTLFNQVAFEGQGQIDLDFKVIGEDVARRCKGVPLTIKCLGALMRQKPNKNYWSFVQENGIWELLEKDDNVFPVLRLSYDHLPSHLKQCFAFCSLFSKDCIIYKDELIHSWRAHGYIQLREGNENIQQIGNEYFNDLLSRSFFQEEKKDDDGNICYTMHDLIHDFALSVAGNKEMEVLPNAIAKLHNLQTLLLLDCWRLKELPRDIRQLISLEYLNIDSYNGLRCLPKGLRELTSLQRLDRFIVNSVSTAATLNELRDLNDLGNCLRIGELNLVRNVELECEEANLKKKKRLQSLQLYWGYSSEPRVASEKEESLLNILEPHPNLKELTVSDYGGARFASWLSSLTNLVKLDIDCCWNCQHLPPLDYLSTLKSLTLQFFNALEELPPLDHLPSLESLTLEKLDALEHVADSFPLPCSTPRKPFFPSLEKLKIRRCPNLKGWWRTKNENQGSIAELPCFPCLSELYIEKCPNLTSMPLFPSLDQDLTLEGTSMRPLQQTLKMKVTEASMTSEASSSSSSSSSLGSTCHSYSSTTLPLSNLKRLTLIDIKDLEALPEEFSQNLTSLARLILSDCPKCESLLPQKVSCLTSLQELGIENCPNLRVLPDWILNLTSLRTLHIEKCLELKSMLEGTHQLTSLQELYVLSCHNLSALPDWIPYLTSLKKLCICECIGLPYLQEGMHSLTSPLQLWIYNCPNLSSSLPFPKTLLVRGCPDLRSLPLKINPFPSLFPVPLKLRPFFPLQELNVQNCPNLRDLLDCIPKITHLKTLRICKSPDLQDLTGMDRLASLQLLSINECPQLSERCEKEIGILWPHIAHIPSIIIDGQQIQ